MKRFFAMLLCLLCGIVGVSAEEITWMNFCQPQEKAIFEKVIERFEETHPGITVKFISVTQDQFAAKIQAAMAANSLPDVFYVGPESIRKYVDYGKLLDLTKYVENAKGVDLNDLYEKAVNQYRYDGQTVGKGDIWAVPKDLGPFALGYNKTMFEKEGIALPDKDVPYTWDQFTKVCQKLTKDTNGDGKDDQYGTGLNIHWSLIQFVWGNGADFIDPTHTKVTITDPKFEEALQYFADMTLKLHMTPDNEQSQALDTYQRWLKGELGFFPVGPWDLAAFKDLPFEFDLIPWPVHKAGTKSATYIGGVGYGVASNTKHPKEAAEFALYLSADKEANTMMCDLDLQIPNLKSLASRYVKKGRPDNRQEYIDIINDYGRSWPADYTYDSVWYDEFWLGVQDVLDGKITAKAYCEKMQPKMQKLLDRTNKKMQRAMAKNKKK